MSSIREQYFNLKNLNNKYLPENIILDLLMLVNNITSQASLISLFDSMCQNEELLVEYVKKICDGYPYQYVVNNSRFCSLDFYVDENVLIPRNETEQLVYILVDLIKEKFPNLGITIFDVCSGSGCIGLSLKSMLENVDIYLSDISENAINVCNKNKVKLNLDVKTLCGDMLEPFISKNLHADVLVSNPPYIPSVDTVDPQTLKYEPHLALFALPSTYFYEKIFERYGEVMNKKFILAFEIGEDMKDSLTELCDRYFKEDNYIFLKDLYDKYRFLIIIRE